ncbi:YhcN/YlaJ family sporulation lipoprotein [Bacillus sp. UMB0893]|uniref:YhcN/YlaJ family sporulation lipoprotein n=1 Tax=Bacillus sp. UMB0893 TaxID=2066053 RepID=UPI000C78723F|nr:YhcN/YlaJ family sporulation lipoprotein [Bacillus sp. UMB0893]PLR68805.1 YhcN/YlaJ family sporulation lipoprotein [Bacillus sp. UMB0893]
MKKIQMIAAAGISFSLLFSAGCAMNDNARENDNLMNNELKNVTYDEQTKEQDRMDVADNAAKKVFDLKEVKYANVIVTDQNAYVAVVLEGDPKTELTQEIKDKIADQVRSTDNNIKDVYVSANPDFFDRMNDYAEKIRNGQPISGLADEFNEMIKRIFPQEK